MNWPAVLPFGENRATQLPIHIQEFLAIGGGGFEVLFSDGELVAYQEREPLP
jgi:hypothetical protein